jgi:hypothetical protein
MLSVPLTEKAQENEYFNLAVVQCSKKRCTQYVNSCSSCQQNAIEQSGRLVAFENAKKGFALECQAKKVGLYLAKGTIK